MMKKNTIYIFPSHKKELPSLSEVGGKGLSLIKGSESGLPVPPGFVLTVIFFEPWFIELRKTKEWNDFITCNGNDLSRICRDLKNSALKLKFTEQQKQNIRDAQNQNSGFEIYAVRSSSPEEDLEGSSFAGGYETVLGVIPDKIEEAVKTAFASCLDERVFIYKRENGFDFANPKIAVVVQQQIPSDVAGVGFSLNPINNSYDQVVINANWGLGETVVSGIVTPDTYIVNKNTLECISIELGAKEKRIILEENGGTSEEYSYRSTERTLSDVQVKTLTELIIKVEKLYDKPIDTEWAFAGDRLYLLQARPITAFTPVSEEMLTEPGKAKLLYQDMTISVQGLYQPLSNLGISFYKTFANQCWKVDK